MQDFHGHVIGYTKKVGSGDWTWSGFTQGRFVSGYGPTHDANVKPWRASGGSGYESELVRSQVWRGYRLEVFGYYHMGERLYDPDGGRFLSPDPFSHAASMVIDPPKLEERRRNLYNYANGDPINFVDPTGRNVYGIDGTRFDVDRGLGGSYSNVFDIVTLVDPDSGAVAQYFGGPGTGDYPFYNQITGADVHNIIEDVYTRIKYDLDNNIGDRRVDLYGWSRGGPIAVEVARLLEADGIDVNFLGLFDSVNMVLVGGKRLSNEIPGNVQQWFHAQKTANSFYNGIPFPTVNYGGENEVAFPLLEANYVMIAPLRPSKFRSNRRPTESFTSTHGDIGVNPTSTAAYSTMISKSRQAGVPIQETNAASSANAGNIVQNS